MVTRAAAAPGSAAVILAGVVVALTLLAVMAGWAGVILLGVVAGAAFMSAALATVAGATLPPAAAPRAAGDEGSSPDSPSHRRQPGAPRQLLFAMLAGVLFWWALWQHASFELPLDKVRRCQQETAILIVGDLRFQQQICAALELLRTNAPARWSFIREHLPIVLQDDSQGVNYAQIYFDPPVAGIMSNTASDLEWCATALAHEADHVAIARRSQRRHGGRMLIREVVGAAAEDEAGKFGAATLRDLGAAPERVRAAKDAGVAWAKLASEKWGAVNFKESHTPIPLKEAKPELWRALMKVNPDACARADHRYAPAK